MERTILGGNTNLGPIINAESYVKVIQTATRLEKGKIYKNSAKYGGDDLYYLCIQNKDTSLSSPVPGYFDQTPVTMEGIVNKLNELTSTMSLISKKLNIE